MVIPLFARELVLGGVGAIAAGGEPVTKRHAGEGRVAASCAASARLVPTSH